MKHIKDYIYEGLFNVDKNIADTHEIEKNLFEDPKSDWWKYCVPWLGNAPVNEWAWDRVKKEIDIDKETITISDAVVCIDSNNPNPFTNKYTLNCDGFVIGQPNSGGPHPGPLTNGGGFKEINCTGLIVDGMCKTLKGFKFNIDPGPQHMSSAVKINWADSIEDFDAEFNFQGNNVSVFSLRNIHSWPNLKNVKSNTNTISLYDSSLFDCDEIKSSLDKFFGTGTVTANGVTKKKNIRNIVAIVNNMRKYGSLVPTEVIPQGSLSDLLDLGGFKNLEKVTARSNNVKISFVKPDNKREIERQARFIRMNNMKLFKSTPMDELIDMVKECRTKDGWVVLFEPEQY